MGRWQASLSAAPLAVRLEPGGRSKPCVKAARLAARGGAMCMCGTCVSIGRTIGTEHMHHKKMFTIAGLATQSSDGASECKLPSRGIMGHGSCVHVWCWLGLHGRLVAHEQPRRATSSSRVALEQPRQGTVALKQHAWQRLCTSGMQPACLKYACTCCGDPQVSTILALRAKAGLCPRPIRCGQSKGPVFPVSALRGLHNVPAIA